MLAIALPFLVQAAEPPPARVTVPLSDGGTLTLTPVIAGDEDYPTKAKRAEIEGTSDLLLTIEPDGSVSNCRVMASAGHPDLDRKVCDLYRERARFSVSDRTTPATARAPVQWVLR